MQLPAVKKLQPLELLQAIDVLLGMICATIDCTCGIAAQGVRLLLPVAVSESSKYAENQELSSHAAGEFPSGATERIA